MQVGETAPSQTEATALGIYDGMWSGWCQAFAGGAYVLTGYSRLGGYPSAAATYKEYQRRGLVQTNISASAMYIGSLIYYSPTLANGSGHVGVYVGNGYVISTQGNGDPNAAVARHPLTHAKYGNPVGWIKPEHVDGQ